MAIVSRTDSQCLICVFAACALLYEMVIATTLVLLFGDVIYYFSLTVAFFVLFMGIGSGISRGVEGQVLLVLVLVELVIALLGASSSFLLLYVAAYTRSGPYILLTAFIYIALIGILIGMELPLLFRLTEGQGDPQKRFGFLLIADYLGSLIGSLLFAFLLLPRLDITGTSLAAGGVNLLGVVYAIARVGFPMRQRMALLAAATACLVAFAAVGLEVPRIQAAVDEELFAISDHTEIIRNFRTRYQKVVVTLTPRADIEAEEDDGRYRELVGTLARSPSDTWIAVYLNGYLQALSPLQSSTDFYHHAFVHPTMLLARQRRRVLVLGGGDGLPAKEVAKYVEVQDIVNVDLDGEWVEFVKNDPLMRAHNFDSLRDPRLRLIVADAFKWVRESTERFDVILVDFPEGIDVPLARSYSTQFLKDLKRLLSDDGVIAFQANFFDNSAFWCIVKTMLDAGYSVIPHHTKDPEEQEGFMLLSKKPFDVAGFDQKVASYPFLDPRLMVSERELRAFGDPRSLTRHIAGLEINTFFRPSFLAYYRANFPWKLSIGAD